jgi:HlyD family secretion protein
MNEQLKQSTRSFFNKRRLIGFGIILVAILIFIFLKSTRPEQPGVEVKQKVWPIKSMTVKLQDLSPVFTLYGTVESNSLVTAASPVAGVVEKVPVNEGDEVTQGQLLVQLATADIELPYQVAKADVADTEAQLNLQDLNYQANLERLEHEKDVLKIKQQDVKRNRELLKKKLLSQALLDQSVEALTRQEFSVVGAELSVKENKVKVEQLKARLDKAKANLEQAEVNRQRGIVHAPFDGRITDVHVSQGDRVNVNAPMVSFYAIESLELRAQIPVAQTGMIYQAMHAGETLMAQFTFNDKTYEMPLLRLDGQAQTSGVDAFFDIPADLSLLRPGDLLKVKLLGRKIKNAFAVPYSAIYGSDRVYLVEEGELQSTRVELVGDTLVDGSPWAMLKGNVADGAIIATTHLPNAITGLKVSVLEDGQ